MTPNIIIDTSLKTVHLPGLGQNVINSKTGGKISARNELLNAPTSDMKRSSLGMAAANPTTYKNKTKKKVKKKNKEQEKEKENNTINIIRYSRNRK